MAKLLYLTQQDLRRSDEEKFYLRYLSKTHNINILNINHYLPNFSNLPILKILINWKQIKEIINQINRIKPNFIFIALSGFNYKSELIKWTIFSLIGDIKLITYENQILPKLKIKKKNIFKELNPRIASLINKIFTKVSKKKFICLKIKKSKIFCKNTLEIEVPSWDGDKYLEKFKSINKSKEKIVFLDEMFVDHPDFKFREIKKLSNYLRNPKNKYGYHEEVNEMLEIVRDIKNKPICICPHPKDKLENSERKFLFPISKYETIIEVAKADLVIAHSSTSINFAVLFKKPLILYMSNAHRYSFYHQKLVEAFQRELGVNVYDQNNIATLSNKEISINDEKYQNYIENFLLPKGSLKTSYEILNEFIVKNI